MEHEIRSIQIIKRGYRLMSGKVDRDTVIVVITEVKS